MRNYSHKKWPKIFSGKLVEILAKILRTRKNLPARTPMASRVSCCSKEQISFICIFRTEMYHEISVDKVYRYKQ